jgi:beta-mannosidase
LYQEHISVRHNGAEAHSLRRQIGLRTLRLDTDPDALGNQFRFLINGVPIFAKGADWIPPDAFITRAGRDTMFFYAQAAKRANMNMLRVWGGGMYENEDFYDACDACGLLVWQDFIFACNTYPLEDPAYLANVRAEVADNVRRLRHRASLALWCGNNEAEAYRMLQRLIKIRNPVMDNNMDFYHHTLRAWVEELDGVTPYWPGSPSAGSLEHRLHSLKPGEIRGDTHLWQIWHGMRPIQAFRKLPTRFCSEYGMESMPSLHTVRTFTDAPSPSLFDPVMRLHQKSKGGNEKILYYLLAQYRNPADFADFVYLSQLVQANTVRFATDCWRRGMGRHNGALFWQFNDCWPVASWAGIDYEKQLKAVVYQARHFNKMLCLSNDAYPNRAELYVANEYPRPFAGTLEWRLTDFWGRRLRSGACPVEAGPVSSVKAATLRWKDLLQGVQKNQAALEVRLLEDGRPADEKTWLLVPDKDAALPQARLETHCALRGRTAAVTLTAQAYARYVYVEAEGVTAPWSDNFFDLPAGKSITLTVDLPPAMDAAALAEKLAVKTLADVRPKNSRLWDKWLRVEMMLRNKNFLSWILFNLLLG